MTYIDREVVNSPHLLNLKNGVFDFNTWTFRERTDSDIFTYQVPVKYDPSKSCPTIKKFISEIVAPEDQKLLYEIIGYCLYPGYPLHNWFILVGSGNNGKSTFINLLCEFLGRDNVSGESLHDLTNDKFSVANLYGKLANVNYDLGKTEIWRGTEIIKQLSAGDRVRGEIKFRSPFYFYNRAKLIFAANEPPRFSERTKAFWRRVIVVEFPYSFDGREDRDILKSMLKDDELSGLLNVALSALKELLERGHFSVSKTSEEIKEEYMRLSDPLYAFVNDCIRQKPGAFVTTEELYDTYRRWCMANEIDDILTKVSFSKRFPTYVPYALHSRRKIGGRLYRGWQNIEVEFSEEGIATLDDYYVAEVANGGGGE